MTAFGIFSRVREAEILAKAKPPMGSLPVYPGSLRSLHEPKKREDLKQLSLIDLSTEMLARLAAGEGFHGDDQLLLAEQLARAMASRLDVHQNRFAARRYYDLLDPILARFPPEDVKDTTVVDLGCGSLNPFTFSFLFLMLGAKRAYAVDLAPIQNIEIATRALATAAGWFLLDSARILDRRPIRASDVIGNLQGFDLPRLAAGNPDGINRNRLVHRLESIDALSLSDGEADAVFSVSLLEHVDRVDDALESLRRITKPGGLGVHVIDFADHRIYTGEVESPFEFLKIKTDAPLVEWSNRIRCHQFCSMFERHGFVVESVEGWEPPSPLREQELATFAEPFRSMRRDDLKWLGARLFVRRS